ncbi:MAG: CopG family transcriptional regulator [bacterium]|nr:CopG family transcriptional regulator [bacterium]
MKPTKRIQVSFTEKQWKLLEQFKGEFGESDSEVIRNIVIIWLTEKSFLTEAVKRNINLENTIE